jgi:hypothetical protein
MAVSAAELITISVLEGGGDDILSGRGIIHATPASRGIATNGITAFRKVVKNNNRSAVKRVVYGHFPGEMIPACRGRAKLS